MKIIDNTSNAGRQIVPEDMNYLSLADQQVVSALESLMKAMTGMSQGSAIVVSGCGVEFSRSLADNTSLYKIANGVVLWNGLLWDLTGMEVPGTGMNTTLTYDTELSIVFDRTAVVAPSPVYGKTLVLDQNPHKNMTARVVKSNTVPKSAESITLGGLKKMPNVGTARGVNALLVQVYAEVGSTTDTE